MSTRRKAPTLHATKHVSQYEQNPSHEERLKRLHDRNKRNMYNNLSLLRKVRFKILRWCQREVPVGIKD